MTTASNAMTSEFVPLEGSRVPMKTPASDDSSFVTGATLTVDGGMSI
jgi:NAD(P)-dependent dehydrogenase (short-subunit alcohol dehydrogenase family)